MKKMKVVQIGALHDHSAPIFRSLCRNSELFEIMGYAIPEEEEMHDGESYEGYLRMSVEEALSIPNLDGVVIETSEWNLCKYALMAAERGLAVHMDKPGGTDPLEFERLIQTVKDKEMVLHFGYMYRYNPAVIKLKRDIEEGKLGTIINIEAQMNCMHDASKREWLRGFPGGEMFFLGCHLIDLIYSIQGMPEQIIPLNTRTKIDGVDAVDFGMAILRYPNGVSFAKTCDVEAGGFMRRQLVVNGSKGCVQLLPMEICVSGEDVYTSVREVLDNPMEWCTDGVRYDTPIFNRYDNMMRAFHSYATGEKKNPFTLDYEASLYRLVMECCGEAEACHG